ncbi:LysM and putative peptidoglycan-binding domain-containing protein 1 [Varanus komodoensis]|uniref:LysM and putative peptidoglycan-binding domain-containing protein 1 n=1 Tax=Varanus komodoensis TaxID=61221 RepID=A0A8D2KRC9_VARKO|nr:lysM and putative peptidoglycan-binding domain-containing protein 1 [Varanus komodoensis]KAF7238361.1 LysM and putative peptidoglycan-binding domain-containing protein 1 [Varanus komodoensis]
MASPSKQGLPGGAGLLQGSRTRSYGSLVKSVTSPARERRMEHRLEPEDTLQGLAVRYGVTTEQIKRANRLYTNDSIFLKKTLYIPVPVEPKGLSSGLNLEEEEEEEEGKEETKKDEKEEAGTGQAGTTKKQKQPRKNGASGPAPKHDLSATDFLFKLDSEIRRTKQAAKKLREVASETDPDLADAPSSSTSYQSEPSPRTQQRAILGPVPLTKIARADSLRDQEDEIFKL